MFKPPAKKEPLKKPSKKTTTKKEVEIDNNIVFNMSLPFPVSNNALHKPTRDGRIVLSASARSYYADMYEYLNKERDGFTTLTARLSVDLYLHEPDLRRRDINNLTKSLFDALQRCEVIKDDHQIDETHIYRRECREGGCVQVIIRKLAEEDNRDNMKEIRKVEAKNKKIEDREKFISDIIKKPVNLKRWKR